MRLNGKEREMEFLADGMLAALPFAITAIVALGLGLEASDAPALPEVPGAEPASVEPATVVIDPVVEPA